MGNARKQVCLGILKGLLAATGLTLLLMAIVAALIVWLKLSDSLLTGLNQVMKVLSILFGTTVAVGRGGRRGFVTGATLAMLYMILGYAGYVLLGGSSFSVGEMLGEVLIGAALGATCGALLSNMPERKRRRAA